MLTEGRNPLSQRVSECRRARGRGGVQSGLRSSSLPSWCLSCCGNVCVGAGDKGPLSPTSPLFTGVRGIGILRSSRRRRAAGIMQNADKPQARRTPFMSIFPTKILLATDGSREAELAGQTAADIAQKTDSELHVLHVLASPLATHDPSSFEPEVWARLEQRERKTLEDVVAKIEASGGKVEGSHHTTGRPDAEIVALAEEIGAGLIVMGARGVGRIRRALTGSVSDSVVRHAHCPVLVVRE